MTAAGRVVELRRYRIPAGERALQAQRIDGRVAVMDVPVDHDDRVYLVERHLHSQRELEGLATEYTQRSQACGIPAILATLMTVGELADAITQPVVS
jgi:hypothetical protein